MNVDRFLLEYDDERSGTFEPLRFVPKGKIVVLGLITRSGRNWKRRTRWQGGSKRRHDLCRWRIWPSARSAGSLRRWKGIY